MTEHSARAPVRKAGSESTRTTSDAEALGYADALAGPAGEKPR